MKTDRELLELAARAIGLPGGWSCELGWKIPPTETHSARYWIPLADDGDALRLAIKSKVLMDLTRHLGKLLFEEGEQPSIEHAVRRAIVRAAAEIQLQKEIEQ